MNNRSLLIIVGVIVVLGAGFLLFTGSGVDVPSDTLSPAPPPSAAATPPPSDTPASTPPSAPTPPTTNQIGSGKGTVNYTASGFIPASTQIVVGETITFVNNSNGTMRVVTSAVPSLPSQANPGFDQGVSVPRGGRFTFVFTIPGEWKYMNLNNPRHTGTVIVVGG